MGGLGRFLTAVGIYTLVLGACVLMSRSGAHRLSSDVVIRRGNFVFYSPLGMALILSAISAIVVGLLSRK